MHNVILTGYIREELERIKLDLDGLVKISREIEFLDEACDLISLATKNLDSRIIVLELIQSRRKCH